MAGFALSDLLAKPSNPTPRPKKDVDGNVAPNKVDKAIKSESVKKPLERKVESVSTKPKDSKPTPKPAPKPAAKKEPAIREIVREPKAKREVPTMASNDPRRKS